MNRREMFGIFGVVLMPIDAIRYTDGRPAWKNVELVAQTYMHCGGDWAATYRRLMDCTTLTHAKVRENAMHVAQNPAVRARVASLYRKKGFVWAGERGYARVIDAPVNPV